MTITETTRACARPGCTNPIEIIPGHRPRRYCSNACKQLAYLQREEEKQQQSEAAARQAQYERDVAALRERYSEDVLPLPVIEAILQLRDRYGVAVADQTGELCALSTREARGRQGDLEREVEEANARYARLLDD